MESLNNTNNSEKRDKEYYDRELQKDKERRPIHEEKIKAIFNSYGSKLKEKFSLSSDNIDTTFTHIMTFGDENHDPFSASWIHVSGEDFSAIGYFNPKENIISNITFVRESTGESCTI